ncbi:MAG: ribonuclease III [Gammaproteobacteria bacterium]|nr:ribonuclease III [Gammaproteobacteria bacterium]
MTEGTNVGNAAPASADPLLAELQRRLDYRFTDLRLLELALTHRSLSGRHNNERLEFLGDAFLGYVVAAELFDRYGDAKENQLTLLRASLVRGKTLADLARALGLGEFLKLGSGELKSGGFRRDSILADAVEAVIGAVLLDGGPEPSRTLILRMLGDRLERARPGEVSKDPKTRLQELLQGRGEALPEYEVVEVVGSDHAQTFTVSCRVPALGDSVSGKGRTRRAAEQQAASEALDRLGGGAL